MWTLHFHFILCHIYKCFLFLYIISFSTSQNFTFRDLFILVCVPEYILCVCSACVCILCVCSACVCILCVCSAFRSQKRALDQL